MQYSIIQDMQDEFLRVNQRQLQIINANKGVALEGPFSVVAGAFKAIIDAFKNFITRVAGWFKERFGGKAKHNGKSAAAVEKAVNTRAVTTSEKFFKLTRSLTEEECTAWLTTTIPDEYKSKMVTKISETPMYFEEYCDLRLATELSKVMTQSLGLALFAKTNDGPAHVPDIYRYRDMSEALPKYISEVTKIIDTAGTVGAEPTKARLADCMKDLCDRTNVSTVNYVQTLETMKAQDAVGLEKAFVTILASGSQRVNTSIFRIPPAYRSYCDVADVLAKNTLADDLLGFTKKAEKNNDLVQLIPFITDAVKTAMAGIEIVRLMADTGLASVTTYVDCRMRSEKEMYSLCTQVIGKNNGLNSVVSEAMNVLDELEKSIDVDKQYLKDLK